MTLETRYKKEVANKIEVADEKGSRGWEKDVNVVDVPSRPHSTRLARFV